MGASASKPAPASPSRPLSEKEQAARKDSQEQRALQRVARLHVSSSLDSARAPQAALDVDTLKLWESAALSSSKTRLAAEVLSGSEINKTLISRAAAVADQHVYSHKVHLEGSPVTNQKSSGRCWLFATTNVIRTEVMRVLNLDDFQLSQSYLFFYDKLEKCNYFLENMIELADERLDSRLVSFLNSEPVSDGGQWDMVVNLLLKYGVVPQAVYPESFNSSSSGQLNKIVKAKLREYALELRALKAQATEEIERNCFSTGSPPETESMQLVARAVRARKEEQMAEMYKILVVSLGKPPKADEEFTWEYYDKDKVFHRISTTPRAFLSKYTGTFSPTQAFSMIDDPRNPYDKVYTVDRLGNVWDARKVKYVNAGPKRMKEAVIKSIKASTPVFFGCDVGQFSERVSGAMDTALFKDTYELAFDTSLGLSKAERLMTGESSMTHAMVITAVHLDASGKPVRWRVENSWSDGVGDKGYMVMTDEWFDEFVYQVVIRKEHAPADLWKLFESGDPVMLDAWDPMGTLA